MTHKIVAAIAAALALSCSQAARPDEAGPCKMDAVDEAWVRGAVTNWDFVARVKLRLASGVMPETIVFDKTCAFALVRGASRVRWNASAHHGKVRLPDGSEIPVGVVSFAKPDAKGTFFVMSLPSVWRGKVTSGLGLERLMHAVALHESSHTVQATALARQLDDLERVYGFPEDITDDSLQEMFSSKPGYVADYGKERDLFYAAATAKDPVEAKRMAREGLAAYRARRAKWFTGDAKKYAALDEVFLSMEGLGQWAGYAWLADARGANVDPAVALKEMRRGGKHWTQEEGLAIFMVLDRLLPQWQGRFFRSEPSTLEEALAAAVEK